jgi:hypothetical protein
VLETFMRRGERWQDIVVVLIITAYIISVGAGRWHDIIAVLIRGDRVNYLNQLGAPRGGSPKDPIVGGGGWTELDLAYR